MESDCGVEVGVRETGLGAGQGTEQRAVCLTAGASQTLLSSTNRLEVGVAGPGTSLDVSYSAEPSRDQLVVTACTKMFLGALALVPQS